MQAAFEMIAGHRRADRRSTLSLFRLYHAFFER